MLQTETLMLRDVIAPEEVYRAGDEAANPYGSGIASEGEPHVALLYGLMKKGSELQADAERVLSGWGIRSVSIENVAWMPGRMNDPSYCIVAVIRRTPDLLEGNARVRTLPHVDMYPSFAPHLTLAYISRNEFIRDDIIQALRDRLVDKELKIVGMDCGS